MFIAYRLDENKSNSATFALLSGNLYLGAADNSLKVKYSIPARWMDTTCKLAFLNIKKCLKNGSS